MYYEEDLAYVVDGASGDLPETGDYDDHVQRVDRLVKKMDYLSEEQRESIRKDLLTPVFHPDFYVPDNPNSILDFFNDYSAKSIMHFMCYSIMIAGAEEKVKFVESVRPQKYTSTNFNSIIALVQVTYLLQDLIRLLQSIKMVTRDDLELFKEHLRDSIKAKNMANVIERLTIFHDRFKEILTDADVNEIKNLVIQMKRSDTEPTYHEFLLFLFVIALVIGIFAFFGYKLYKSLTERQRKREEKIRAKTSKKKK